jgi:MFS family permease
MGMIGAAFGIGFTLGPPLGGIATHRLSLAAPGLIAATICGLNLILALFRLPESLPPELRSSISKRTLAPLSLEQLSKFIKNPELGFFLLTFFLVTFAFSTMEQTFSLLFQTKFGFETGQAGLKTGMVLMVSGVLGAVIQGGLIRIWVPRFGERRLLLAGLLLNCVTMAAFPFCPSYALYFVLAMPLALGSGLINPSLSSLISKSVGAREQGGVLGLSQGLGSLARALGPFCGLVTFAIQFQLPYLIASGITLCVFILALKTLRKDP